MHIGGLETNSSSCLDSLAISVVCLSAHLYYSFGSSRIGRSIFSLLQCLATNRSFVPALLPLHHVLAHVFIIIIMPIHVMCMCMYMCMMFQFLYIGPYS